MARISLDQKRESALAYPGWRVVGAAFFGVMCGYSVLIPYTFSLFLNPLDAAFGWRRDQTAMAMGCVAITVALCSPIMGHLLDRYGPRRTILPCLFVFGVSFASLSLQTASLPRFYATFVLLGLAGNGTTQLAYSRAVSTWFFARRGVALSLVASGAGVGAMALPVFAAWLLRTEGWRATYAVLGLFALAIGFPLTLLLVRESNGRSIARQASAESMRLLPSAVSRPYRLLILAVFLYSVSFNGIISQFSVLLTDRGLSLSTSARALSVIGFFGLAGRLVTGYLLDKFFAARVSVVLLLTTVAGVLLLSRNSVSSAFFSAAMLGFSAGGESDITPYLLSRYFGLRSFSTLYGLAWTAFALGTAVGPVLMGRLYASVGSYPVCGVRLAAIPALLSSILMLMMPTFQEHSHADGSSLIDSLNLAVPKS